MLDSDLARLYGVETKVLNQAVKRNIQRFPDDFMFQLTKEKCLRSQIVNKRLPCVTVDIYDGQISKQLCQDVEKHNEQYPGVTLHKYRKAHDRFLIIDEDVYHIGASLKDLGKKLFAFSRMADLTGSELLAGL